MHFMHPILKWVGSKRWIAHRIAKIVCEEIVENGIYHEPFVGAGAVLMELDKLKNQKFACDIVESLIHTYNTIQENPIGVWSKLRILEKDNLDKDTYLKHREKFNQGISSLGPEDLAAHFIYLNHAGYNGLWRTNKNGEFNVPFGNHKKLHLPDQVDFLKTSQSTQNTHFELINHPREIFDLLHKKVKAGDVVFSDPPYLGTYDDYDEFSYSMDHFHEELACTLWDLHLHGATIIAMNSDNEKTNKWYGAFCKIENIDRYQGVAGTNEGRREWKQILAVAR